MKDQKNSVIP